MKTDNQNEVNDQLEHISDMLIEIMAGEAEAQRVMEMQTWEQLTINKS